MDTATMVGRILAVYARADDETRAEGRAWYAMMREQAENLARAFHVDTDTVVGIIAATSPRVRVQRNLTITRAILRALVSGQDMPTGLGVGQFIRAGWKIAHGDTTPMEFKTTKDGERTGSQKTRCFYRNILGDESFVTIDTWATKIALGADYTGQPANALYRHVEDAYAQAAERVGETPAAMQAITWIAYRGAAW